MSSDLYALRVCFEGGRGLVKMPGLLRHLTKAPQIEGLPELDAIDYTPEVHCAYLQPAGGARRDMLADEITALQAWMARVALGQA